jgi:hypothetical protein
MRSERGFERRGWHFDEINLGAKEEKGRQHSKHKHGKRTRKMEIEIEGRGSGWMELLATHFFFLFSDGQICVVSRANLQ